MPREERPGKGRFSVQANTRSWAASGSGHLPWRSSEQAPSGVGPPPHRKTRCPAASRRLVTSRPTPAPSSTSKMMAMAASSLEHRGPTHHGPQRSASSRRAQVSPGSQGPKTHHARAMRSDEAPSGPGEQLGEREDIVDDRTLVQGADDLSDLLAGCPAGRSTGAVAALAGWPTADRTFAPTAAGSAN